MKEDDGNTRIAQHLKLKQESDSGVGCRQQNNRKQKIMETTNRDRQEEIENIDNTAARRIGSAVIFDEE